MTPAAALGGAAQAPTPWGAVQRAAWEALNGEPASK